MKIALCFCGLPKFLNQNNLIKKHIIEPNDDVDIFVHSWGSREVQDHLKKDIKNLYPNIKGLKIEEQIKKYFNINLYLSKIINNI